MAVEIERKFLVHADQLPELPPGVDIQQGYIPTQDKTAVRVRLYGARAYLTLKGVNKPDSATMNLAEPATPGSAQGKPGRQELPGIQRLEFEYEIPVQDARQMLQEFCPESKIEKTRHQLDFSGFVWEIDFFHGLNQGLVLAEVELASADLEPPQPPWTSLEVTRDVRYFNSNLVEKPWPLWCG